MLRQINMWSAAAPGKLLRLHRTDLHDDGLHRVVMGVFPSYPYNPNSKGSLLLPPAINPIRVCIVTIVVPETSHEGCGTVISPLVLVFVKGGELHAIVKRHGVS
mgnify:CR=1 FL=1